MGKSLAKPKWNIDGNEKIVEAFTLGGVQYYQFENPFNMMCGRGFVAMDFYNEVQMKCTREFLQQHCEAVEKVLNDKQIKLTELLRLNLMIKERLDMIVSTETIYKLASVVYFDKNEQPYNYDHTYNLGKIRKWKEHGIEGFFLTVPLKTLIPSLDLSKEDLIKLALQNEKIEAKHLNILSSLLSGSNLKPVS